MRWVFADTSFFVAMIGERDQHHRNAVSFMRYYQGRLLTTDFVVLELATTCVVWKIAHFSHRSSEVLRTTRSLKSSKRAVLFSTAALTFT